MAEQRKKLRLGELLVQQGLITTDQLAIALAEQRHNNIPLGRLLVRLGFVTETAIRDKRQEMVRRAYDNGDIYLGTYEGWYCPNEGFKAPSDLFETSSGMQCPNHPGVPLQWLSERNWFFRLSAYQDRLLAHFEANPDFVQPDYRRNEMLGFIRQGLEDFSISRAGAGWGIPFPIAENGETAQREDGSWDPEAGTIYVWYDALINYITGAGFPDDMDAFGRWWPADLHIIGKDILRFHTIF